METLLLVLILQQFASTDANDDVRVTEAYITAEREEENFNLNWHTGELTQSDFVSHAYCEQRIDETGWASLVVDSSDAYPDHIQAYYSGYLETNITYDLTVAHWNNTFGDYSQMFLAIVKPFLETNMKSMLEESHKNLGDPSWYLVYLHLWQLKGIEDAFNGEFVSKSDQLTFEYLKTLNPTGIYLLQLYGDIWTFSKVLQAQSFRNLMNGINRNNMPDGLPLKSSSCSLLIKVHENDIYVGHVTWAPYSTMLRVLKRYSFPWKTTNETDAQTVEGSVIVFSSYPSVTFSGDDFYLTNQQLVVSKTSIPIYNRTEWSLVLPKIEGTLFTFIRAMLANRFASTGREWAKTFSIRNSGTFNSEWLIFNAKRFNNAPNKSKLPHSTLILLDQIPSMVKYRDVTKYLNLNTYFASYNIPFLEDIYNTSGYRQKNIRSIDNYYDRSKTTRSLMFAQKHSSVVSMETMHKVMRYNDYTHDPLSECTCSTKYTATKAISARRDLNPIDGTYSDPIYEFDLYGGTDAKIVNLTLIKNLEMMATSGPTFGDVDAFKWSAVESMAIPWTISKRHLLQPDIFKFQPIITNLQGRPQQIQLQETQQDASPTN